MPSEDNEFQNARNRLMREIQQLNSEVRERQEKIQALDAANRVLREMTGRPMTAAQHLEPPTGPELPRGFYAETAQQYVASRSGEPFTTSEIVNHVYDKARALTSNVKRPNVYSAVYEALRRMQDENANLAWSKQEPPGTTKKELTT